MFSSCVVLPIFRAASVMVRRDQLKRDRIVYLLARENWEFFYVGKGYQKRPGEHLTEVRAGRGRNRYKANIIRHLDATLGYIPTIVLATGLTDAEACAMEILLIAAIGRKDKGLGPLVNMTDGGDGSRGYVFSIERKKQYSVILKNAFTNPVAIKNLKEGLARSNARPESHEHRSDAALSSWEDPQKRQNKCVGMKAAWSDKTAKER